MQRSLYYYNLYIFFFHTFAAPAWMGSYRPCPDCIPRALFLQPRCALLAWLWLRVAIDDKGVQSETGARQDMFLSFVFFFFSIFFSSHLLLPNVFLHMNWETARLCPAVFAKEAGCNEVANRAVASQLSTVRFF